MNQLSIPVPENILPSKSRKHQVKSMLTEAIENGLWTGHKGRPSKRKSVFDTPIFSQFAEESQASLF